MQPQSLLSLKKAENYMQKTYADITPTHLYIMLAIYHRQRSLSTEQVVKDLGGIAGKNTAQQSLSFLSVNSYVKKLSPLLSNWKNRYSLTTKGRRILFEFMYYFKTFNKNLLED